MTQLTPEPMESLNIDVASSEDESGDEEIEVSQAKVKELRRQLR